MKIYVEEDEGLDRMPLLSKGSGREHRPDTVTKFIVIDTDGNKWVEHLSHDEAGTYRNQGYTLKKVPFWNFWL